MKEINELTIDDLMEVTYDFNLEFAGDGVDSWDYIFTAQWDDQYYERKLPTNIYIEELRRNCKAILKATEGVENEY